MAKAELASYLTAQGLTVTGDETRDELFEAYVHLNSKRS